MRIRTAYVGPTDFKGSRIIVTGPCGQLTVSYDHSAYDMHDTAVDSYIERHGITSHRPEGPDTMNNPRRRLSRSGRGYVYTLQS